MNPYLLSILLGIVEGLTEFLPISSTAHLRICESLFHVDLEDGYWKMYSIVIQLGAVLCVPVYFRKRIAKFVSTWPKGESGDRNFITHPLSLTLIAFAVTAAPSYLLSKVIGENLESMWIIGLSLLIGGAAMWIIDRLFNRPTVTQMEKMSVVDAIWIGAAQILAAVFPGTSRSMATIAAGQMAGMSREAALEFSFFLSIPTMFVATGWSLLKVVRGGESVGGDTIVMDQERWVVLAIGFVVSFFVAWAVVAWFMHWVKKHGFVPFAIYRIVLGTGILVAMRFFNAWS